MENMLEKFLTEQTHLLPDERKHIFRSFEKLIVKKNDFFVSKGEVCKHIAFGEKGIMRFINETDCEDITMQFVLEQSFTTSLTSFVYQTPSIWSIRAITDCELMVLARDTHFALIRAYQSWLEFDNIQLLKTYTELENRVFTQFHLSAEQRFEKLFTEHPQLFNLAPLKQIASYLGITPETLSRLRKRNLT